ncbi:hypothetical protein MPLSOD_40695 [Mesorhizobium sp. SOD10]|nr:hypothetical protein MPLSOD_40695 [Mesorhizobium sp. SOD10]
MVSRRSSPCHGACRAACRLVQVMKPNRSVQLMLTVRVTKVNAGASHTGAASQDSRPK